MDEWKRLENQVELEFENLSVLSLAEMKKVAGRAGIGYLGALGYDCAARGLLLCNRIDEAMKCGTAAFALAEIAARKRQTSASVGAAYSKNMSEAWMYFLMHRNKWLVTGVDDPVLLQSANEVALQDANGRSEEEWAKESRRDVAFVGGTFAFMGKFEEARPFVEASNGWLHWDFLGDSSSQYSSIYQDIVEGFCGKMKTETLARKVVPPLEVVLASSRSGEIPLFGKISHLASLSNLMYLTAKHFGQILGGRPFSCEAVYRLLREP